MEPMRSKSACAVPLALLLSALLLVLPVFSSNINDQKNYYSPDPHAGTPPHVSHKSPPYSHGGSPPSGKNCGNTPKTSTPSHPPSGGGHYNPPSSGGSPPTTPINDPGTPSTPVTGTCNFWRSHPGMIWGVVGWWGTLGNAFGATNVPGFGTNLNLLQALSNTRTDGFGALCREGTASYLNSLVNHKFPFTTEQVRSSFVSALRSEGAAANQADVFKLANEGKLKPRA